MARSLGYNAHPKGKYIIHRMPINRPFLNRGGAQLRIVRTRLRWRIRVLSIKGELSGNGNDNAKVPFLRNHIRPGAGSPGADLWNPLISRPKPRMNLDYPICVIECSPITQQPKRSRVPRCSCHHRFCIRPVRSNLPPVCPQSWCRSSR